MKSRFLLIAVAGLVGCGPASLPQPLQPAGDVAPPDLEYRLVMVGDAGGARLDDPILAEAARVAGQFADRTAVVFLGDNVYPAGLVDEGRRGRRSAVTALRAQRNVVLRSGTRGIFIPGNHDWGPGGSEGFRRILAQASFVSDSSDGRIDFLPGAGCPGPEMMALGDRVALVSVDSHWWLVDNIPAAVEAERCVFDASTVADSLRSMLRGIQESGREVVFVTHHPPSSGGPHGGYFGWQDHIFPLRRLASWAWLPLPLVGSLYPAIRNAGITAQDLTNGRNWAMIEFLDQALVEDPPVAWVAGHEHTLQLLRGRSAMFHVVSGTGFLDHRDPVSMTTESYFALSQGGFAVLDFVREGGVRLSFHTVGTNASHAVPYSAWLVSP